MRSETFLKIFIGFFVLMFFGFFMAKRPEELSDTKRR